MRQKRETRKRKRGNREIGKQKRSKERESRRGYRIVVLIFLPIACFLILLIWERSCEKEAHKMPAEEWQSLDGVLHGKGQLQEGKLVQDKEQQGSREKELAQEEVLQLKKQTGICEETIRELCRQNRMEEFYDLHKAYFGKVTTTCSRTTILTCEERVVDKEGKVTVGMKIPMVEDGDILVTNCSHFLGWRNGHAAIVVDAQNRQILEARAIGLPSVTGSLDTWETYPSFLVLRLKDADKEFRRQIAEYAKENLIGIPYRLTAGLWGRTVQEGTQCAHLVWSAYRQFGVELKKSSLGIATPKSLAGSEQLIIVQQYGTGQEF